MGHATSFCHNAVGVASIADCAPGVGAGAPTLGFEPQSPRDCRTRPMAFVIGSEIYGRLEMVVDRFDDVANEISSLVIEHV